MHTWIGRCFSRKQYLVHRFPFGLGSPLLPQLVADARLYKLFGGVAFFLCMFSRQIQLRTELVTYLSREIVWNPGFIRALYLLAALYLDGLCLAYGHRK